MIKAISRKAYETLLVGASENVGSRLLAELVRRGHEVTAIARHPEKIEAAPSLTPAKGDLFDDVTLAQLLTGHEAVISSVQFMMSHPHKLLNVVRASGVRRYLVVGGAGSLEVAPGVKLMDTPKFPAAAKSEATKGTEFLELLRQERDRAHRHRNAPKTELLAHDARSFRR